MTKQELVALGLSEENADKVLKDFVPYERFKQVNDDKKALDEQLKERDKAIEGLKAGTKTAEEAQKAITDLQKQLADKDAAVLLTRKDAAIQVALAGAKAKNAKAAMALLDTGKLELQEDGSVKGLKEALEGLQKSEAYLFEVSAPAPAGSPGFNPPPGGAPPAGPLSLKDAVSVYYDTKK